MSSQLAVMANLIPAEREVETMLRLADIFLKSGLMPSAVKTPAAAFTIIQTGRELGIPPMAAIRGIAVIDGKPTVSADLMAALIQREHGDDAVRFLPEECDERRATGLYRRRGWNTYSRFVYTIEDANRAGLTGKRNWQTHPAAMLRARWLSSVAKMAFNDTCNGLYLPEELNPDVRVDEAGAIVEMPAEPVRLQPVEGGALDEATGEFSPLPDIDSPIDFASTQEAPSTVTQHDLRRLHAIGKDRTLTHADLHALAYMWFNRRSVKLLTGPELNGLCGYLDRQSAQALSDEQVKTEVALAYQRIEQEKAKADPAPGTDEPPAGIVTWDGLWRFCEANGVPTKRADLEAWLGEPVKNLTPQQARELVELRLGERAELEQLTEQG